MTSQQHADHLLAIYQARRALPPAMRLADVDKFCRDALVEDDGYDATLEAVALAVSHV